MSSEGERIVDLDIPHGLDYKKWQFLVKGLLKTDADKNPVNAEELSRFTSIPISKVISNIKFLKLLGLLKRDSKSSGMSLTEDGAKYAQALFLPDSGLEKELLGKFVKTGLQSLVDFYSLHSGNTDFSFDRLFNQVKIISRTNDVEGAPRNTHTDYRNAIYTIIEILVASGSLPETFLPRNNEPKHSKTDTTSDASTVIRNKTTFEIPVNVQHDWMIKLFTAISRANPSMRIDRDFITANVDKNSHQGTILSFAQFLGIVDNSGGHGENFDKLRLYGTSEFVTNLAEVVKAKYSKILSTANLELAQRDGLEALIMRQYGMNKPQAERAVNTLIRLCELAHIPVSDSLVPKKVSAEKPSQPTTKKAGAQEPTRKETGVTRYISGNPPEQGQDNLIINIQIHIDAKDESAFSNTLKFIRELKSTSNVQTTEILIPRHENEASV